MTLPKIGEVKFRLTPDIPGTIKNVTVTSDALGWHIVVSTEVEHTAPQTFGPAVGIDRGATPSPCRMASSWTCWKSG